MYVHIRNFRKEKMKIVDQSCSKVIVQNYKNDQSHDMKNQVEDLVVVVIHVFLAYN